MLLIHAIEQFLAYKSTHCAANSLKDYALYLKRFAEVCKINFSKKGDLFPVKDFSQISPGSLIAYANYLNTKASRSKPHAYGILRQFLHYWQRHGEKCALLWDDIRIPRQEERHHEVLSKEDFERMDALFGENEFWELQKKVIINLAWDTGIRVGEIKAIDIQKVDIQNGCAYVAGEKSKQWRWVSWSDYTNNLLKKYIGVRLCMNEKPWLFQARARKLPYYEPVRVSTRTIERWIRKAAIDAKLDKHVVVHSIRHGFGTDSSSCNVPIKTIKDELGHKAWTSVDRYTRLSKELNLKVQTEALEKRGRTKTYSQQSP